MAGKFSLAAAGVAALLSGCASGVLSDRMPAELALPDDAPARPAVAYEYPAVHDMPAARPGQPLSAAEQIRMENDLQTARDRQAGTAKKPGDAAKTTRSGPNSDDDAGAKTSGVKTNP
jgi:hypothetical protein